MATLLVALAQPSLVQEVRSPVNDVAVLVEDRSASMTLGDRRAQADEALTTLRARLGDMTGLEVRVVRAGDREGGVDETHLFGSLEEALADVPRRRLAGVIVVSDGQVHDVPATRPGQDPGLGPVHLVIAGEKDERDRRIQLVKAPSFGLVGDTVEVLFRVDDLPEGAGASTVPLTLSIDGEPSQRTSVILGQETRLTLPIDHGGQNLFELEVPALEGESALANNRLALVVNGVRDRLRVLLVSGEPHNGERTWRNLLKADPSVDLVHFTILRPPTARDDARNDELSLIAFPVEELFQQKLEEFDLIIFDRYRQRSVLNDRYFRNMVEYVRNGGAMLVAGGPETAGRDSLYSTRLGEIMPGYPDRSDMIQQSYRPQITELGLRHPVTMGLEGGNAEPNEPASWGPWFRQMSLVLPGDRGQVVMKGVGELPLVILEREGEGRVAQIGSDHVWLWSRGFGGGGPQAELLRRTAHWLMKEPELEERDLRATVDGTRIRVERRDIDLLDLPVLMTPPVGEQSEVAMNEDRPGVWTGTISAGQPGIYRFTDGVHTTLAVVGRVNPPEFTDTRATAERFQAIGAASGGGQVWLADGVPGLRRVAADRTAHGDDWIGIRANQDYVVDRVTDAPLLPAWLALAFVLGTILWGWWRESA